MRLLAISLVAVILAVMSLFGARNWGLSLPYQKFDHAFWAGPRPLVAAQISNVGEAKSLLMAKSDVIFWIDVVQTSDRQLIVLSANAIRALLTEKSFPAEKWRGPFVSRYSLQDLRAVFSDAPLVKDLFAEFPQQRWIVNVVANEPQIDELLVQTLEPMKVDGRVLVQSEIDTIIRSVKERKPLWLYGSSQPDLMKLMTFESMWIEPAAPFRGDALVSPLKISNRDAFNAGVIAEVRRRKKEVLLGPINDGSELAIARAASPDGYIFGSMELAMTSLRSQEFQPPQSNPAAAPPEETIAPK